MSSCHIEEDIYQVKTGGKMLISSSETLLIYTKLTQFPELQGEDKKDSRKNTL